MPHVSYRWRISMFVISLFNASIFFSQNPCSFYQSSVFIPFFNQNISAPINHLCDKNVCLYFIKHQNQNYLKVTFETLTDSTDKVYEKFKSEIEIKSNSKSYYKKDYPIYAEKNQLFFLLQLPPNYIKTLIDYGITEIVVAQKNFSLNKRTTRQVKEIATCLLSEK